MELKLKRWSYSLWALMEKCPAAARYSYIEKLPTPPVPAMERGNLIHKLAENYLNRNIQGVPQQLSKLAPLYRNIRKEKPIVEQYWNLDAKWLPTDRYNTWIVAKSDVHIPPTKRSPVLYVGDHKTGREYDNHVFQGSLYGAVGYGMYPKVEKIEVEFYYTDQGTVATWEYNREQIEHEVKYWLDQGRRVMSERKFLPRPTLDACNAFGGCPYRDDKKLKDGRQGPCKSWRIAK